MTKTRTAARDATPPNRGRRPRRPLRAERQPTPTFDDLLFEARAAHQRWRLLWWLGHELEMAYGPGDREDPPLPLASPTGGQEPPIRAVVEELRAELLSASFKAHARYQRLVATQVDAKVGPVEPVFEVECRWQGGEQ